MNFIFRIRAVGVKKKKVQQIRKIKRNQQVCFIFFFVKNNQFIFCVFFVEEPRFLLKTKVAKAAKVVYPLAHLWSSQL